MAPHIGNLMWIFLIISPLFLSSKPFEVSGPPRKKIMITFFYGGTSLSLKLNKYVNNTIKSDNHVFAPQKRFWKEKLKISNNIFVNPYKKKMYLKCTLCTKSALYVSQVHLSTHM